MSAKKKVIRKQEKYLKIVLLIFLITIISITNLGCAEPSEPAASAEVVELNLSHWMSTAHTMHTKVYVPLQEEIAKKTDGRVQIYIHPGGALASGGVHYEAAETGVVDVACVIPSYTRGRFPLATFPELPFLFESASQAGKAVWELYNTTPEMQDEFKDTKLLMLATVDIGQLVTSVPVKNMEDLRGLEIRSPGPMQNALLTRLGATPVSMPISDVYDALERGVVQGAMVPYSTLRSFNLQEVITHVMELNLDATTIATVMNLGAWEKLSPQDQETLMELGEYYTRVIGESYDEASAAGKQLAIDEGIEIIELSDQEFQEWIKFLEPMVEEWIAEMEQQGLPGREIYEKALGY